MIKRYKSDALATVHETALGLTEAGVMPKRTMKVFDELCLTPVEDLSPEQIRAIRVRENASQAVFARYLYVTEGLVSQWERGEKRPCGASLKLLTLGRKERAGRGCLKEATRRPLLSTEVFFTEITHARPIAPMFTPQDSLQLQRR